MSSSYKEDMKSLVNVPSGEQARLVSVSERMLRKLRQYGLHLGDTLRVLRSAPMGGPLLVEVNGRELALGRAVAEKLFVETECESR
jgi:ferrous iron transport protein A